MRKDILNGECPRPITSYVNKGGHIHNCIVNPNNRNRWIEIETYLETGDLELSTNAAIEQILMMYNPSGGYLSSPDCLGIDQ